MKCKNCGHTLRDTDLFCTNCGTKVERQEQESVTENSSVKPVKKTKFPKIAICGIAVILVFGVVGALISGKSRLKEDIPNQEIDAEWEAAHGDGNWEEPDLSEYDILGEWSDGKRMVHKTEGSYDYVEGSFAYIDTQGNILGEWHSDKEWLYPTDFCNDRALVYLGDDLGSNTPICDHGYDQKAYYSIIDEQGQERFSFLASLEYQPILEIYHNKDERVLFVNRSVHEFEDNGYLFFTVNRCVWEGMDDDDPSTWPKSYLLIPDEDEFVKLISFESYTGDVWNGQTLIVNYDLDSFAREYVNGFITYQDRYKANGDWFEDYLIFDMNGKIVLDVAANVDYQIVSISDVRDNKTICVEFVGVDGNHYTVDMKLDGTWGTKPEKVG